MVRPGAFSASAAQVRIRRLISWRPRHFDQLRAGRQQAIETSALYLDVLRDLKRINAHLVEAAANPRSRGRSVAKPPARKPRLIGLGSVSGGSRRPL